MATYRNRPRPPDNDPGPLSRLPERVVFDGMIQRCYNPHGVHYDRYGGRGIRVCARWRHSFPTFLADMGRRPSPAHQIDRIDNDRGYSPRNCRWALRKDQCRNRSSNHFVTFAGRRLTLVEWSEATGLCQKLLGWRIRAGWDVKRALTTPPRTWPGRSKRAAPVRRRRTRR